MERHILVSRNGPHGRMKYAEAILVRDGLTVNPLVCVVKTNDVSWFEGSTSGWEKEDSKRFNYFISPVVGVTNVPAWTQYLDKLK